MSEWTLQKISDVSEKICVGFVGQCQQYYCSKDEGVPMIRTTNLTEEGISFNDVKYVSLDFHTKNIKSQLKYGDILVARHGDNGKACMYTLNSEANCLNAVIIRLDALKINTKFFLFLFNSPSVREIISSMSSGSVQDVINTKQIAQMELRLPTREIQDSIASILSSLDDKIDLLHRQNKTLEQLAETLFRQWFVVEADSSWKEVNVSDVCTTITKGTTPTTLGMDFTDSGVKFLKAESFTNEGDLLENKFAHISYETHEKLSRSKIQKDDLIITIAGTIGRVAIIPERVLPVNTNQAVAILRPNKKIISSFFLYCLFKSDVVRNDFEGRIVHAVQPNLSLSEIGNISFKLPPEEKLKNEGSDINTIFQKKEKNNIQIRTLTQLRDTLLPKLMSGEVKVKI